MRAILIPLAYLLGSFPTGLVLGKTWRKIDLREVGSGNIGAANAYRHLGPVGGAVVLVGDLLKGLLPVLLVQRGPYAVHGDPLAAALWQVGLGMVAILGHNNSIFLGFKGGKGIATTLGVVIALNFKVALICFAVWALVMAMTRYASLASLCGAVTLPLAMFRLVPRGTPEERQALLVYMAFALMASGLAFYKHRKNLIRLREGTEPRLFSSPEGQEGHSPAEN
ncbi:MAG TPA: glycerol-3-phosphate 1-O-acyltransferase PlsY [Candidatus Xenobia bacterium]|jgi:glycerol-3-phosphate acyltransferase PlsY